MVSKRLLEMPSREAVSPFGNHQSRKVMLNQLLCLPFYCQQVRERLKPPPVLRLIVSGDSCLPAASCQLLVTNFVPSFWQWHLHTELQLSPCAPSSWTGLSPFPHSSLILTGLTILFPKYNQSLALPVSLVTAPMHRH